MVILQFSFRFWFSNCFCSSDLAVGAPHEGNGAVYLFFGGPNGLSSKPNQRIIAPKIQNASNMPMFGHSISKGVDIDGNSYMDFAIGAPNSELVYVYQSYPVVRINAMITPQTQEIKSTDRSIGFTACWSLESPYSLPFAVYYQAMIKIDGQSGRAMFSDQNNFFEINSTITYQTQCVDMNASVTFSQAEIYKPLELEMIYVIVNTVPSDGNEFCKNCVATNPNDPKAVTNEIVFSTGCKKNICVADLALTSSLVNANKYYILGSTSTLIIEYSIKNSGETAYLTQLNVTLPESNAAFSKIPSHCKFDEESANDNVMICVINDGSPMFNGDSAAIKISIDTTKLFDSKLVLRAQATSKGEESNENDNLVLDEIELIEFSNIEIIG